MIITDIDEQRHFWVRCTCAQTREDGTQAHLGYRYFVVDSWSDSDCGACTDHPKCEAGALTLAGLPDAGELFCAADFEPVEGPEADALMAGMIVPPAGVQADIEDGERVAAEAYQVVGNIAHAAGLFEHPEIIRALDYFSGDAFDGSILPFGAGLHGPKDPKA